MYIYYGHVSQCMCGYMYALYCISKWCCINISVCLCSMRICITLHPLFLAFFTTARFWGDPHFNTFDGLGYTFNGKGEFWLVRTTDDSVSIQVRLSPFGSGAATVITAAVVQFNSTASANAYIDNNGVIVEIGGQTFAIEDVPSATYVGQDGTVYEVDMMSSDSFSQLENVSFILDNDTNTAGGISISPTDGSLSVTVRLQSSDVLSVTTDLNAAVVRGKTRGLLGVINGNISDDFTLPNGTITDVNATDQSEVYYQFGLLCKLCVLRTMHLTKLEVRILQLSNSLVYIIVVLNIPKYNSSDDIYNICKFQYHGIHNTHSSPTL